MNNLPTRKQARELLGEHVKDDYQIYHSESVAKVMEAYAEKFSKSGLQGDFDAELWYLTGLLHDLDYFEYPELHPQKALEWFAEWGYPTELIHAIDAHYVGKGAEPKSLLAACLIATDELCGFLYAYSLMRPTGFEGMDVKGVKKRLKDLRFAARVNREDIKFGLEKLAEMLGKSYEETASEHYQLAIEVLSR